MKKERRNKNNRKEIAQSKKSLLEDSVVDVKETNEQKLKRLRA